MGINRTFGKIFPTTIEDMNREKKSPSPNKTPRCFKKFLFCKFFTWEILVFWPKKAKIMEKIHENLRNYLFFAKMDNRENMLFRKNMCFPELSGRAMPRLLGTSVDFVSGKRQKYVKFLHFVGKSFFFPRFCSGRGIFRETHVDFFT